MITTSFDIGTLLPSHITEYIGRKASYIDWERHFAINKMAGISPQWQVLEEGVTKDAAIWGLHSVTVETASTTTAQTWPESLPGEQATMEHARTLFGEPLMHQHGIAVFQITSPQGLDYAALCTFAEQGVLQSLTMIRVHDWLPLIRPLSDGQPIESIEEEVGVAEPIEFCRASTLAPLTGWYEGRLPDWHPMQAFFAKSDTRLVFREKGERFPNLGVTPHTDEALVQWSWAAEVNASM